MNHETASTQPDTNNQWDPGKPPIVNSHLTCMINVANVTISAYNDMSEDTSFCDDDNSQTKLDSHANMPVVDQYTLVLATTNQSVEVDPFTPDYLPMTVPLVDAAL